MTRSKSTEIKNNNTISLRVRALKSHLIIPKNWFDTKRWDSRGGALTLTRGGAKEIIRLNFNVSILKQEITEIYKTVLTLPIHLKAKLNTWTLLQRVQLAKMVNT